MSASARIFQFNPRTKQERLLGTVDAEGAIGKGSGAAVRLDDLRCDGIHALIEPAEDGRSVLVTDLGSHFGTYHRGRRVTMVRLRPEEVFVIGGHHLFARVEARGTEPSLPSRPMGGIYREDAGPFLRRPAAGDAKAAPGPAALPGPGQDNIQVTLYWGEQLLDQKAFRPGEEITLGTQREATFGVTLSDRRAEEGPFTIAKLRKDGTLKLNVPAEAGGLIWVGGEAYNVDHLRHRDPSVRSFGDFPLKLKAGDRADLAFGELTLSFRYVAPPERRGWRELLPAFDAVFLRIGAVMFAFFLLFALWIGTHEVAPPEVTLEDLPREMKRALFDANLAKRKRMQKRHRSAIGELAKDKSGGRAGGEEGRASAAKTAVAAPPESKPAKHEQVAKKPEQTRAKDRAHLVKGHQDESRYHVATRKAAPRRKPAKAAHPKPAPAVAPPKPREPTVDLDAAFSAGPKARKSKALPGPATPSAMDAAGNTVAALTEGGSFARGRKGAGGGGGGRSVGIGSLTGNSTGGGMGAGDYGLIKTKGKEIRNIESEELVILGGLDRDIIAAIIRRYLPQIQHCYEQQLVHDPKLKGKVTVAFTIAGTGSVQSADVAESSLRSPPTEKCMLGKIMGWKFPKPRGGGTVGVRYPFLLMSNSK
jgi:outer membrane biosynthesis protein TonB